MCVNSFSSKKVTSFPKVAANKSSGKASGDERLNLNYGCDKIILDNIGQGYDKKLDTSNWNLDILLVTSY
jgi:hypothetical protein